MAVNNQKEKTKPRLFIMQIPDEQSMSSNKKVD